MLAVIDTNVLVAGLLTRGTCHAILSALPRHRFTLITSQPLFKEFCFVIERPKFDLLISQAAQDETRLFIKSNAVFVHPKTKFSICRDPKDNIILEAAVAGKADFIVSGDKDLLVLKSFRGIPILTPAEFLKRFKKQKNRI